MTNEDESKDNPVNGVAHSVRVYKGKIFLLVSSVIACVY